jgi:hypothetical protein
LNVRRRGCEDMNKRLKDESEERKEREDDNKDYMNGFDEVFSPVLLLEKPLVVESEEDMNKNLNEENEKSERPLSVHELFRDIVSVSSLIAVISCAVVVGQFVGKNDQRWEGQKDYNIKNDGDIIHLMNSDAKYNRMLLIDSMMLVIKNSKDSKDSTIIRIESPVIIPAIVVKKVRSDTQAKKLDRTEKE